MSTQNKTATNQQGPQNARKRQTTKPSANKADLILQALGRKTGASVDELCRLTDWQPHSVRGFLSGTVRKKLGHQLSKGKDAKGVTRYSIVKSGKQS